MGYEQHMHAVIADDLTGASDTGVQFARTHLRTRALLGDWTTSSVAEADVIVINTESRALSPAAAYDAVAQACTRLRDVQARPVYKKIDSTMRGPVGNEIDAVLNVFGHALAVVCPAFPDTGRIVVGGHLLVEGQPVARTPIGHDPVAPVKQSYLPALLAAQSKLPVHHIPLGVVEQGAVQLGQQFEALQNGTSHIVVVDAAHEKDLETIVQALKHTEKDALLVGSAGLARPLAVQLASAREGQDAPEERRSALIIVGSVNPVSRKQITHLQATLQPEVVSLDAGPIIQSDDGLENEADAAAQQVRRAVAAGRTVLLTTPGEAADIEAAQTAGAAKGMDARTVALRIASALGATAAAVLTGTPLAGIVVTGGDTAQALLRRIGANGIDLVSEVLPGIPIGRIHGGPATGLSIVTKAGGFGGPDALAQAAGYLDGLS